MNLAPYASDPSNSKGRVYKELQSSSRNDYQRDRDRIIHSASFRRLQYKTQVFVNHEGDMFRSRLTHSLEVSQISRAIARTLNCHEDLCEAVALAHDLGHTPFGHAGQDALNECMRDFGGFEHNLQSLRVVDFLEQKYINFDGLNLTFEVREGILKHCSKKNARLLGDLGKRFITNKQASVEAQIVNFADEIAYLHHDLDDGLRSGILNLDLLNELDLFKELSLNFKKNLENHSHEKISNEIIRRMMAVIIDDLCLESMKLINSFHPMSVDNVRSLPELIVFSPHIRDFLSQIKRFSREHIYNHPRIDTMTVNAKKTINDLFYYFSNNFEKIPDTQKSQVFECKERVIADYIAGMTDRFALQTAQNI